MAHCFVACDRALGESEVQCKHSGTTAVVGVLESAKLTLASVGDSRAVLARKTDDNQLAAVDLTKDHNPDIPEEKARIEAAGGFVRTPRVSGNGAAATNGSCPTGRSTTIRPAHRGA